MKKNIFAALMMLFVLSNTAPLFSQENKLAQSWVEGMKQEFPKALCKDAIYFRQCFKITETECKTQALQSFEKCLIPTQTELYKKFGATGTKDLAAEGAFWGGKLGECSGIDFEKSLLTKRINSDKCNDPKNWTGK